VTVCLVGVARRARGATKAMSEYLEESASPEDRVLRDVKEYLACRYERLLLLLLLMRCLQLDLTSTAVRLLIEGHWGHIVT